jgi:hypothetical protein
MKYYIRPRSRRISYIQKKRIKANWIANILPGNCLLKHIIEGKLEGRIEVTRRRRIRGTQLLDDEKKRDATGN